MLLEISDELLERAGIKPGEALIVFACRLFDAGKLDLWPAAQLAGLSRVQFERELHRRKIAIYQYTLEDYQEDLKTLEYLDSIR